jgi:hypothetical protein
MSVYIPIATGQTIHQKTIDSIESQNIKPKVIICDSPGEIDSDHNHTEAAIKGEVVSRNLCIDEFLKTSDKYFFNQCRGLRHKKDNNLENMIKFMDSNLDFGACTLRELGGTYNHITMGIVCIRRKLLEGGFRFANRYKHCLCVEVMEDIRLLGYKYGCIGKEITVTALRLNY